MTHSCDLDGVSCFGVSFSDSSVCWCILILPAALHAHQGCLQVCIHIVFSSTHTEVEGSSTYMLRREQGVIAGALLGRVACEVRYVLGVL